MREQGIDIGDLLCSKEMLLAMVDEASQVSEERFKHSLGIAARHHYTGKKDDSVFSIYICYLDTKRGPWYYFVFRDGLLLRITRPNPSPEIVRQYRHKYFEESTFMGSPMTRRILPRDPFDETLVDAAIHGIPFTVDNLISLFDQNDTKNEPLAEVGTIRGYGRKTARFMMQATRHRNELLERIQNDYRKNVRMMKLFNGARVRLGMSIEDVDALLGPALHEYVINRDEDVFIFRIHGDEIDLGVYPEHKYANVAVMYLDGRTIRVLSGSFFDSDWSQGRISRDGELLRAE